MIGADYYSDGRGEFSVWAPFRDKVELHLLDRTSGVIPMERNRWGYWLATVEDVRPGERYRYRLDGVEELPDPASQAQPTGVHGPSQVVDHGEFPWRIDDWPAIPLEEMVLYELHVGTFSEVGTFDGVIERLDFLRALGVNCVEIMPVAQFPGGRNWGYDGVFPFAVQDTYGGIAGFKRLCDACHERGMNLVLDVVYNHLGPEGNYLPQYGPYFTDTYKTPWGPAMNFDGPYSDGVRNFFIENALYWFREFRVDALRLDAVHAIYDRSARPFLLQLSEVVDSNASRLGRPCALIAESNLNDSRMIRPRAAEGGLGLDAQWNDDFHHAVHAQLTGETGGYYEDFDTLDHLVRTIREGFAFSGQYSEYRKRCYGNTSRDLPAQQFVTFTQNHDQTGNRMLGERLSTLVGPEGAKLAAGLLLLTPGTPLLFMGQEYGETAPFQYFISHTDEGLVQAVREGRKKEFAAFGWQEEPPDPFAEETFERCRLDWSLRDRQPHAAILQLYRTLLDLRRRNAALHSPDREKSDVIFKEKDIFALHRWANDSSILAVFHLGREAGRRQIPVPEGRWRRVLDSAEPRWCGPGDRSPEWMTANESLDLQPMSFVLYERRE